MANDEQRPDLPGLSREGPDGPTREPTEDRGPDGTEADDGEIRDRRP